MIISAIVFLCICSLVILSRKMETPKKKKTLFSPFYKVSYLLSEYKVFKKLYQETVKEHLKRLYPTESWMQKQKEYYIEKIAVLLGLLCYGSVFVFLIGISNYSEQTFSNGNEIMRNQYGKTGTPVDVIAHVGEQSEEISYMVSDRKYTKSELEVIFQEIKSDLQKEILNENTNVNEIKSNLNLVKQSKKYPVTISWSCNRYQYLDMNGTILNEEIKKPEAVILTATLSYELIEKEVQIPLTIMPKEYSEKELFAMELKKQWESADYTQSANEIFVAPDTWDTTSGVDTGTKIYYQEKKEETSVIMFFLLVGISVILYFCKDKDLSKKIEERNKQLLKEYPEFVSKLSLFMGAGMTIKMALKKMSQDYQSEVHMYKNKKVVYEELRITLLEMENGIFEEKAYDNFGKRCRLGIYIKLTSLLSQNLKKGTRDILKLLEKETTEAFIIQKNNARKLGEEAGTKLLLPMMLMLFIVIIIIIVPAFLSYQI